MSLTTSCMRASHTQVRPAGDVSLQRGIEATDKLISLLISFVGALMAFNAIGLDVQSVLAISGFGGLALGLAGREILENLFNGLLIISSRSFEVGEEIMFTQARASVPLVPDALHGNSAFW
jgi:small-conductance mechanosensitive channel